MTTVPAIPDMTGHAARRLNDRLVDMERHLDQYGPVLVDDVDGTVHLAWGALQPHQADVEPYPHQSPQSHASHASDTLLDFANTALTRRLEDRFLEYGQQVLHGPAGEHPLARSNPAGFRRQHDLQVVWLGSRRKWMVLEGAVRWRAMADGESQTMTTHVARTLLAGTAGWICLQVRISPEPSTYNQDGAYTLEFLGIRLEPDPVYHFPTRFLSPAGVGEADFLATWGAQEVNLPVALVEPPSSSRRVPRIVQFATGSWDFSFFASDGLWHNNFPRPRFSQIA